MNSTNNKTNNTERGDSLKTLNPITKFRAYRFNTNDEELKVRNSDGLELANCSLVLWRDAGIAVLGWRLEVRVST